MALQYITKNILKRDSGEALLELPYDIGFIAGYDFETLKSDILIQTYGVLIMARPGKFVGDIGHLETQCTGTSLICDVLKNDVTIYSSKPQFAVSTSDMSVGVLSTTTFVSGDRITFKVTQIGSSAPGQGLRFMLKCKV